MMTHLALRRKTQLRQWYTNDFQADGHACRSCMRGLGMDQHSNTKLRLPDTPHWTHVKEMVTEIIGQHPEVGGPMELIYVVQQELAVRLDRRLVHHAQFPQLRWMLSKWIMQIWAQVSDLGPIWAEPGPNLGRTWAGPWAHGPHRLGPRSRIWAQTWAQ
jgi:hypothetical protein